MHVANRTFFGGQGKILGEQVFLVYSGDYIVCNNNYFVLKEPLRTPQSLIDTFNVAITVDDYFFFGDHPHQAPNFGMYSAKPSLYHFITALSVEAVGVDSFFGDHHLHSTRLLQTCSPVKAAVVQDLKSFVWRGKIETWGESPLCG